MGVADGGRVVVGVGDAVDVGDDVDVAVDVDVGDDVAVAVGEGPKMSAGR